MAISGVDRVVFGVADLAEAERFLNDWGVARQAAGTPTYTTRDGGEVIVRQIGDPSLPPAIEPGNTVREVVWGATDQAAVDTILGRIRFNGIEPVIGADGIARVTDPNGLSVGVRVTQRKHMEVQATPSNGPGAPRRIDARSPVHDHAEPISIGHVVIFASDYQATLDFYQKNLGFVVSDSYPGHGTFLRCRTRSGHHDMFVLNRPGKPGFNHVAFTVSDIHEVIGGGLAMSRKGWKTEIGPGRHPISSAYFWYFHNPLGPPLEYYADEDYCTEAWQPAEFVRKPELFAEWAIAGGLDGNTRRQIAGLDNSGRGHA